MFRKVRRRSEVVKCLAGLVFGASPWAAGSDGGWMKDGYDESRRPRERDMSLEGSSIGVAVARLFVAVQER